MEWWQLELITNLLLAAIIIVLGPLIKRFGRAYAADVFRANPRTGKSYLVLMDFAYYLIFSAYVLFTASFQRKAEWFTPGAQLEDAVIRIGGILLLMGLLHGINVLSLPLVGRLLGFNRALEEDRPAA